VTQFLIPDVAYVFFLKYGNSGRACCDCWAVFPVHAAWRVPCAGAEVERQNDIKGARHTAKVTNKQHNCGTIARTRQLHCAPR
jgi:hypothetical protein